MSLSFAFIDPQTKDLVNGHPFFTLKDHKGQRPSSGAGSAAAEPASHDLVMVAMPLVHPKDRVLGTYFLAFAEKGAEAMVGQLGHPRHLVITSDTCGSAAASASAAAPKDDAKASEKSPK